MNERQSICYSVNDKHFWAAFFNLARHNIFITTNHISRQLGIKPIENDQNILDVIKQSWKTDNITNNLRKKAKLYELILKHFPFLESASYGTQSFEVSKNLQGKNRIKNSVEKQTEQSETFSFESIISVLITFIEKLQDLRNYYSHHKHSNQTGKPLPEIQLIHKLYNVLDTSVRLTKEDYKHNLKINPKEDFEHLIRKGKAGDNPKFKHHFERNREYTEAGLLFFVSLFLDKKDAIWMQKKIYGFKRGDTGYTKMTNEVFCRSRIIIPKIRLISTYDHDQMLLDILNELARCPKPLFDRLREEDRKKFKIPLEIVWDEEEEDTTDEDNPLKSMLIRHQNRFPYFALRYFDLKKTFKSMRFQIDLGSYHFSIYDKLIGTQNEKRHLTRSLYGFDRIQVFDDKEQPKRWKELVKDLDYYEKSDLPFISKTKPHYHLFSNKIGIKFIKSNTKRWPNLDVEEKENGIKKYTHNNDFTADAFLSVHELTPMMFYYLLTENGDKVEGVIKSVKKNIFALYDAFEKNDINSMTDLNKHLEGKNILVGDLPKQMVSILSNIQKNRNIQARQKQDKLIEETQKKIDQLKRQVRQDIRIGKRKSGLMKPGIIAKWLINDMMRFQPVALSTDKQPLNRSKANSTEYQLLQRTFAFFGSEKKRLPAYFIQLRLINSENPHPFLSKFKWEQQPNILSFYENYLKARLSYLKQINPEDWQKNQHFLQLKGAKTNRKKLVEGWKNGFNLPRGIFTNPIKEWLKNSPENSKINEVINTFDRAGFITKTIPFYFKENKNDGVPSFYHYKVNVANTNKPKKGKYLSIEQRAKYQFENKKNLNQENTISRIEEIRKTFHEMSDKEICWKRKKSTLYELLEKLNLSDEFYSMVKKDSDLTTLKKELLQATHKEYIDYREWQKFEKKNRLLKSQDILLWMMCNRLQANGQMPELQINGLFLKDIGVATPGNENINILNKVLPMRLPVSIYPTDESGNVQRNEPPVDTFYIEEKNTKVLKQGNFKALVKDRRLNGLFSFVNKTQHTINKNRLEHELTTYQRKRVEIFSIVLDIEKKLTQKYPNLPCDNFRSMINKWMEHNAPSNLIKALITIRNAFAHNQYPMYKEAYFGTNILFDAHCSDIEEKDGLGVALQLVEIAKEARQAIYQISKI